MARTIGVDLGGTKIQTVVLDAGTVTGSDRVPTPQSGADDVVAAIVGSIRTCLAAASPRVDDPTSITAIGIGSPGRIDTATGVVDNSPNLPGFDTAVPLAARVAEGLNGIPTYVDNDIRVAVRGERRHGGLAGFHDALGVFMGTGVGGGLIIGDQLVTGRGALGEIGHTIVKDGGRRCGCGGLGHLEAYAGRAAMEQHARHLVDEGHRTILFDLMAERGRTRLSSSIWARALERHDRMATRLLDQAAWAMSIAMASVQNLLDLEAIMIGGGLGDRLGAPFIDDVRIRMLPLLHNADRPPQVIGTTLQDLSGAVGAAVLADERSTVPTEEPTP